MNARGRHVGVKRCVLDQRDIGHGGAARQRTFEQIVTEHAVLRQAAREQRVQGVDMEQTLAGESSLAEQILIDLGAGRAVGVHATVAGKQPVIESEFARARQRRCDAGLQDGVAAQHGTPVGPEPGLVLRVRRYADQFAQASRWQLRVAVERDDVAGLLAKARDLPQVQEGAGGSGGKPGKQLFELAALALPADPALLGLAKSTLAVQQQKARRGDIFRRRSGMERVDFLYQAGRVRQQRLVRDGARAIGVAPVAQQGKLGLWLRIGEVVQAQAIDQPAYRFQFSQHGRNDHQHPVLRRDARQQGQASHVFGWCRLADQTIDQGHHGLGGGEQHQQGADQGQPGQGRDGAMLAQQPGRQPEGADQDRAKIDSRRSAAHQRRQVVARTAAQSERAPQRRPPGASQPVARHGAVVAGVGAVTHQVEQHPRNRDFAVRASPGQTLDAVQGLVARGDILGFEHRRVEHDTHQGAGTGHDVRPVGVADGAQRAYRIAHAQIVCRLVSCLLRSQRAQVGQHRLYPVPVQR